MSALRKLLDFLYLAAGVLAALCLISILSLIVLQMIARWTGEVFPGAPNYAGYAMAAASFFAFANALNRGAHIQIASHNCTLEQGSPWLFFSVLEVRLTPFFSGAGGFLDGHRPHDASRHASWLLHPMQVDRCNGHCIILMNDRSR